MKNSVKVLLRFFAVKMWETQSNGWKSAISTQTEHPHLQQPQRLDGTAE